MATDVGPLAVKMVAGAEGVQAEQVRAARDLVEAWRKAQPVRVGGM